MSLQWNPNITEYFLRAWKIVLMTFYCFHVYIRNRPEQFKLCKGEKVREQLFVYSQDNIWRFRTAQQKSAYGIMFAFGV